jgi:general transcription factor IIIA
VSFSSCHVCASINNPVEEQFDDEDDEDEDGSYYGQASFSNDEMEAADTPNTQMDTADTPVTVSSPGKKQPPCREKTIKCTYVGCNKTFNRLSTLAIHLRSHANERPYVCNFEGCDKSYIDEKHLKRHIKSSHSEERPYECQYEGCTKSFLTGTRLRRHQAVHEGENRFRCTIYPPCTQSFRKHSTLDRHVRTEHMKLVPFPCTFKDPITLQNCNAGFTGQTGLRKHEETVHGLFQYFCPQCVLEDVFSPDGSPMYLGFTTNAQLEAHVKKDHVNCPFCDRKCSSRPELNKHIESQHSGTTLEERKIFPCTWAGCNKTFTKKYNLDVHFRSLHEGIRYICGAYSVSGTPELATWDGVDGCGKQLTSKANLVDHVRTAHLGLSSALNANRKKTEPKIRNAKPSALDELLGTAYENDERRTFKCVMPDCPKKFIREFDLNNHIRNKHPLLMSEVDHVDEDFDAGAGVNFGGVSAEEDEALQTLSDHAEVDWASQGLEFATGKFWIGADDGMFEEHDQWATEEMEMRRLIDRAESNGHA